MGVATAVALRIALDRSSTHVSTVSLSCSSGFNGKLFSRHSWNVVPSVHLKSRLSVRFMKVEQHVMSINSGKWSELSAEQSVRLTGVTRFLVKMMSKTLGMADWL